MHEHEISIRITDAAQLFDVLDPAPFREKSLSAAAEVYLIDCAGSLAPDHAIDIVVAGPQHLEHELPAIREAVHGHFAYLLQQAQRRWKWRAGIARRATALGLVILVVSVALRGVVDSAPLGIVDVATEGLLVLGWVALWRPIEHWVFDRAEHRGRCALLARLSTATLKYRSPPEGVPLAS